MTEHRSRDELPFVHIVALNWTFRRARLAGDFMCRTACIQIRADTSHRTAYMRLNHELNNIDPLPSRQRPWICVQLVVHRKRSLNKQIFVCPRCATMSTVLYWMSGSDVRCRHCCPLPDAMDAVPSAAAALRRDIRRGTYGQVAEHLKAGGRAALAGMIAMEMEGLTPPRLTPERMLHSDFKGSKRRFWRKRPKVWLRSTATLIYAEGELWTRAGT